MTKNETFIAVGKLIFPGDDWKTQYSNALGIPSTRIRDIIRGRADLNRDGEPDRLLDMALALAERELAEARRRVERLQGAVALLKDRG